MQLSLLAALDRQRAIGHDNALLWHLPDDLKRFKALTLGKPVLMGRKTAQSLGRALPKRRNLVMTRSGQVPFDGMQAVSSLQQAIDFAAADAIATGAGVGTDGICELCVIGGAEIYALALPLATRMFLTHVEAAVAQADTWFPLFDSAQWTVVDRQPHAADDRHAHAFTFVDYQRFAPGGGAANTGGQATDSLQA
ncbi:dihydrofolate reductase [Luteimonas sp. RIT-PG2_3]